MPYFDLQFPPSDLRQLARRFPDVDESPAVQIGAAARERGYYTKLEFVQMCRWKTPRSAPRVARNSEAAVVEATGRALTADDEEVRIRALLGLDGVGMPTASVLLHFALPDDYPILDVRALESLGISPHGSYRVGFWLEYVEACRKLARRSRVSLRTLDKALWQYSKERARDQM